MWLSEGLQRPRHFQIGRWAKPYPSRTNLVTESRDFPAKPSDCIDIDYLLVSLSHSSLCRLMERLSLKRKVPDDQSVACSGFQAAHLLDLPHDVLYKCLLTPTYLDPCMLRICRMVCTRLKAEITLKLDRPYDERRFLLSCLRRC
jgi:hypothetical protein